MVSHLQLRSLYRPAAPFPEAAGPLTLDHGARLEFSDGHLLAATPFLPTPLDVLRSTLQSESWLVRAAGRSSLDPHPAPILPAGLTIPPLSASGRHTEGYLIPADLPLDLVPDRLLPFLVIRSLLSATFLSRPALAASPRLHSLGPPNLLPESAPSGSTRVLTLAPADAPVSLFALWLSLGSTWLVLQAILQGAPGHLFPSLADPAATSSALLHGAPEDWTVPLRPGLEISALHLHWRYLEIAWAYAGEPVRNDPAWVRLFKAWEKLLSDLAQDWTVTADRLDWSLPSQTPQPGLPSFDPEAYSRLDRETGLYWQLQRAGRVTLPVPLEDLSGA